jgi:UDP-galactopyranose mutase
LLNKFGFNKNLQIFELFDTKDKDLEFLAQYVYEKIFLEYTIKQWGLTPDEIDRSVLERIPIYISRDDRYFQDKYQGIPVDGYTEMLRKILDHENIKIQLKTQFDKNMLFDRLFWTGSIDEFFDFKFGVLPYRSITFDFLTFNQMQFQEVSQVNYPTNYDFTRITEHKHFLRDNSNKTIVSYEYPAEFKIGENERQYPIANGNNVAIYAKYIDLAKSHPNVHFFGRLGDYKYYNMDEAVIRAFRLFDQIK